MSSCAVLQNYLFQKLQQYSRRSRWVVAYSGGLDSTVLLYLVSQFKKTYPQEAPDIIALHVNHQLNPHANDWEQHGRALSEHLGIPFYAQKVVVAAQGEGIEAAARQARYEAFAQCLQDGDVLLQAHHANDQAETLLLRLMRGAGVTGLAAMPESRPLPLLLNGCAYIYRPLLSVAREQLFQYAERAMLSWVDDDSNVDTRFDRNFLRQDILPRLMSRWPSVVSVLSRTAAQMANDNQLLRALGDEAWQSCVAESASGEQALVVPLLLAMSAAQRHNALRSWLMARDLSVPEFAMMKRLDDEVLMARRDAEPCLKWADLEAHRYANRLFIFKQLRPVEIDKTYEWDTRHPLAIEGVGQLQMSSPHAERLSVRFRQGGERCRPSGRAHSQALKKLFQEYRVPTWMRDRTPLVYRGEELIAVAGLWVCEGGHVPMISIVQPVR